VKQAIYRALPRGTRFYQDHQWWVKLDDKTARHASEAISIDMRPQSKVMVRGEEPTPAAEVLDDRRQMQKREGFFLLIATWLESLNW